MRKIRAYRRRQAARVCQERHKRMFWVEEPGKLRKNKSFGYRCDCAWCTSSRKRKLTISKEDKELMRYKEDD